MDIESCIETLRRHESDNNLEAAENLCLQLLKKFPKNDILLVEAARMATRRHAPAAARTLLYRALSINPLNPAAYLDLGMLHYEQGERDDAERYFRKALLVSSQNIEALRCLGTVLNETGRFHEAALLLKQACQLSPESVEVSHSLADALHGMGQNQEAYPYYQSVLDKDPDNLNALISMSVVCEHLGFMDEARNRLMHACELAPDNPKIYLNLGGIYRGMLNIDQALENYRKVLELDPDHQTARWNICQIELLRGNYREGFREFDSRFHTARPVRLRKNTLPTWNGEPIAGKRLLVQTEQAYGDTIQFVRYVPLLAEMGAKVVLENHLSPLASLLHSLERADHIIVGNSPADTGCDYSVPLLSVPRLLNTTLQSIPRTVPYLASSSRKRDFWRNKLHRDENLKIGICWAGRKFPDPRRTVPPHWFKSLADVPGIYWYSLQINEGKELNEQPPLNPFIDLTAAIHDFEDTAALITCLDLVISIDSAVAHLAGALAAPTLVLLPFSPDWRWLLARGDCPWYPTMHLFRQPRPGDWGSVMDDVFDHLSKIKTR